MADAAIDVSVIRLGLHDGARAALQAELRRLAEAGDTGSQEGLVQLLGHVVDALLGARASWTHGAVENAQPASSPEAEQRFVAAVEDARGRFPTEVIRNAYGEIRTQDPPALPDPGDAPGAVVVTLVVAAYGALVDVPRPDDREGLERALDGFRGLSVDRFAAMEVIWSPAEDADRVSVADIEARYPELARLP